MPHTFVAFHPHTHLATMFASVAAFTLLASAAAVAPLKRGNGDVIQGQYMVVFHKDSAPADREAHINKMQVCDQHT